MSINILNLGAGVQSTTVLLMSLAGELPRMDAAIFADTKDEPTSVYRHLAWLNRECRKRSVPLLIRSIGRLSDGLISRGHRKGHTTIPAFTKSPSGKVGKVQRQCTGDYKIDVVERAIRRDILGLLPGQRVPKGSPAINQFYGLSFEEMGRAYRVRQQYVEGNRVPGSSPSFPLIEMQMTRRDCLAWLQRYGVPHEVPRSACVFCPFKNDSEWRKLRDSDPKGWRKACAVDTKIRTAHMDGAYGMHNPMFLHRSCLPLAEAPIDIVDDGQGLLFAEECTGGCGV